MYHRSKTIKELVDSRISGQEYTRIPKPGLFTESGSSLQSVARTVLGQGVDPNLVVEMQKVQVVQKISAPSSSKMSFSRFPSKFVSNFR